MNLLSKKRQIFLLAGLLWVLFSLAWRFFGFPEAGPGHFLGRLAWEGSLLGIVCLGFFGFGAAGLSVLGLRGRPGLEHSVLATGLGMGMLAHLILLLGLTGLLRPILAAAVLLGGILFAGLELAKNRAAYASLIRELMRPRRISWFAALLGLLFLLNWMHPLFSHALLPPVEWDEVAYHLAIPKLFVLNQGIIWLPGMLQSNWPLEMEMLYTFSLLLGSESLAHLIVWLSMGLTGLALLLAGRRFFSLNVGLLAAAIYSATPMVVRLSGTALVEIPLSFFSLLALYCLLLWNRDRSRRSWILSAIFGGLAASTKLVGAVIPLLLGLFFLAVMIWGQRATLVGAARWFITYGFIALAVAAPWYLKTWYFSGNPFWPFAWEYLGGSSWDSQGSEYLFQFLYLPNMPMNLENWASGLWRLTFQYQDFGPHRVELGVYYLLLLPLVLVAALFSADRTIAILLGYTVLGYTAWFFGTHQTRFLMPLVPAMALACAAGVAWLWRLGPVFRWRHLVRAAAVLLLLATNWLFRHGDLENLLHNVPYLAGHQSRAAWLQERVPGYEVFDYLNEHLAPDATVLLGLYEVRGYYLDAAYIWLNPVGQRVIRVERMTSSRQLAELLAQIGIDYVVDNERFRGQFDFIRYGREIEARWVDFLKLHTRPVMGAGPLQLYELDAEGFR